MCFAWQKIDNCMQKKMKGYIYISVSENKIWVPFLSIRASRTHRNKNTIHIVEIQ